jgi:hypothetical protein
MRNNESILNYRTYFIFKVDFQNIISLPIGNTFPFSPDRTDILFVFSLKIKR